MQAALIAPDLLLPGFAAPAAAPSRQAKPSALRSLIQMWEEEPQTDEEESETELMVALSGMVGAHAMALDGE
jgi:hypothetical protein